jgi:hypothetical protein
LVPSNEKRLAVPLEKRTARRVPKGEGTAMSWAIPEVREWEISGEKENEPGAGSEAWRTRRLGEPGEA